MFYFTRESTAVAAIAIVYEADERHNDAFGPYATAEEAAQALVADGFEPDGPDRFVCFFHAEDRSPTIEALFSALDMTADAPALARQLERIAVEAERLGLYEPATEHGGPARIAIPAPQAQAIAETFGSWYTEHRETLGGLAVRREFLDGHLREGLDVILFGRRLLSLRAHKLTTSGQWASETFGGWSGEVEWRGSMPLPSAARAQHKAEKAQRREHAARYQEALTAARADLAKMDPWAREALALESAGVGPWSRMVAAAGDAGDHVKADDLRARMGLLGPCCWLFSPGQMGGTLVDGHGVTVSCPGALKPWASEWGPAVEAAREAYRAEAEARAEIERAADRARALPVCPTGMGEIEDESEGF